jgi:hypothetical protein
MNRCCALLLAVAVCFLGGDPAFGASSLPGPAAECGPDGAAGEARRCPAEMPFFQRIEATAIQSCKACWTGRENCAAACDKLTSLGEQEHCMAKCNVDWRCTQGFDCK